MTTKVEFNIINVEDEITNLKKNLHNGSDEENEKIFGAYPMLLRRLKKSSNDSESDKIISKFFRATAKDAKTKATKYKQVFQRIWNIVNDDFMNLISTIIEEKIEDNTTFNAKVTFSPITSKDSDKNQFSIYLKTKTRELKDIVFSGVTEILLNKKFNSLNLAKENDLKNHFIELATTTVLNDTKMQKLSIYKKRINPIYSNIIIGDDLLPNIIKKMYKEKSDFNQFFKDTWKLMLKNKESIKF